MKAVYCKIHTPLVMLVPTRVIWPFTLSDLGEETTKVDPGSVGASSV